MGCGLLINFKFSKKFNFFYQNVLLGPDVYAVTDPIVKRDCEEDSDEATGAEFSSDEGEDAGPGEVHSEPHPPPPKQKSCIKPHTIHHKVAII